MNELTKFLVEGILNEATEKVVALFGGGFKPPTKGHLEVVNNGIKQNPEVTEVKILVGGKERDGFTQDQAVKIWNLYNDLNFISKPATVIPVSSPFSYYKEYLKDNPDDKVYIFIGSREGDEDDKFDVKQRSEFTKKYSDNAIPVEVATAGGVSGTLARKLFKTDIDGFRNMFPENLLDEDFDKILDILNNKSTDNTQKSALRSTEPLTPLDEAIIGDKIKCDNCSWSWKIVDGGDDLFMCHKCGHDNTSQLEEGRKKKKDPKKGTGKKPKGSGRRLYTDENPKDTVGIKFSSRQDIVDTLNKKSFKAKSHARQSQIINLIHQRVRAAYGRAKDPAVKKRLKSGLDYITNKKEASKKKTQRLKKQKLNEFTKSDFNRVLYYRDYFTNLSPSTFDINIVEDDIMISGINKPFPPGFDDTVDTRQVPVNQKLEENIDPKSQKKHKGKSAPFGSAYEPVEEIVPNRGVQGSRYRAIEKRGDKYYYIQDNPFSPGVRQEFGPYKTKAAAKRKMGTFPPAQNYRDITEIDYDSIFRTQAYLKTNTSQRTQGDILSDIRSLPGVTIVGSKDLPNRPSKNESILSIKVDPYPFTKMDNVSAPEAVDYISSEIRKINGVERFQVLKKRVSEGDTYEKMAAKGKKAGSLKQGTVRKRLKIPKDKKIPLSLINKEISRLKKMDKDKDKKGVQLGDKNQKYYKALQLSKTLKTTTNVNEVNLITGKNFGKDKLKEITPIIFLSHDDFKENEIRKLKKSLDSDPSISSRYVGIVVDLNKLKTDKGKTDFNKLIKAGNSIVSDIKNQLKNKFSKLDPVVYVGYNPKKRQIKDISGNKFIILNRLDAGDIVANSMLQFRRGADEMAAAMARNPNFGQGLTKVKLNENATYSSKIDYKQQIKDLTKHMIKKGMNILPLPRVIFKHSDVENASQFLGKTAYYSPSDTTIVLYTEGRHPKDIARSFAHEMIHHIQNLEGRLENINTTNTNDDDHLNDIEREAYTRGNMVFRNWTDNMDGEEVSSLNEIGDASSKPFPFKKLDGPSAKDYKEEIKKNKNERSTYRKMYVDIVYGFTTDKGTAYRVNIELGYTGVIIGGIDFMVKTPDGKWSLDDTNRGEQFRVMSTIKDIIFEFIEEWQDYFYIDQLDISPVKSEDGGDDEIENEIDSRRGKLYLEYIRKNLSKLSKPYEVKITNHAFYIKPLFDQIQEEKNKPYKHKSGFNDKLGKDPFGLNQYARELVSEVFKKSVTIDMDPIIKYLKFGMPTGQETDENVLAIIDTAPPGKVPHPVFLDFYAKFDKYFGEENDSRILDSLGLEYILSDVLNLSTEEVQTVINHYNTTDQDNVEWFEQHDNELEKDEEYNIPGFNDTDDNFEDVINYRKKQLSTSLEEQEKVRIFNKDCGCDKA